MTTFSSPLSGAAEGATDGTTVAVGAGLSATAAALEPLVQLGAAAGLEQAVMSTAAGPFAMETSYTFSETPSGATKVELRNRGRPSGFGTIVAPAMVGAMKRANRKDLARLKAILERERS